MLQSISCVKINIWISLSIKGREVKAVAKGLLHYLHATSVVLGMWVITK